LTTEELKAFKAYGANANKAFAMGFSRLILSALNPSLDTAGIIL